MFGACLICCKDGVKTYEQQHLIGKYKTVYRVFYPGHAETNEIYSNNEVYSCSFQGTNFLLEKDNPDEILSTTAPIKVIESSIIKNNE